MATGYMFMFYDVIRVDVPDNASFCWCYPLKKRSNKKAFIVKQQLFFT